MFEWNFVESDVAKLYEELVVKAQEHTGHRSSYHSSKPSLVLCNAARALTRPSCEQWRMLMRDDRPCPQVLIAARCACSAGSVRWSKLSGDRVLPSNPGSRR